MTPYLTAIRAAMSDIAARDDSVFVGQSIRDGGTAMRRTLDHIPNDRLVELPVMEEAQLGLATGLALQGRLVVCVYPRFNFLLLATNAIVNHLDKLPQMADVRPRAIIRVGVPSPIPLHPGHQHLGNYAEAFRSMLTTVQVYELTNTIEVNGAYARALDRPGAYLMVEHTELYDGEPR